jgi:hypothetical protein
MAVMGYYIMFGRCPDRSLPTKILLQQQQQEETILSILGKFGSIGQRTTLSSLSPHCYYYSYYY